MDIVLTFNRLSNVSSKLGFSGLLFKKFGLIQCSALNFSKPFILSKFYLLVARRWGKGVGGLLKALKLNY